MILLSIILIIIFIYLAFNVGYLLLFAIAGLLKKSVYYAPNPNKKKIAVLIPAYQEDNVIIDTAQKAANHPYPSTFFDVIVIADGLQPKTLATLSELPVRLIEVSFQNSTKAKSLKFAFSAIQDDHYDIAMILDSDNIMGADCLEKINAAFHSGFSMVQLHRTAKNKNTATAILDGISEEINNHIFRKGHRALGLSSALIGSGMAFYYKELNKLMQQTDIENNPGEDREIFLEMLKKGAVCEYIDDAMVYDEKVQSSQVLEKQRTRWLSAQMQYTNRFWLKEFVKTFSYNIHYFDNAVQTLLLPRIMLIAATFIMSFFAASLLWSTGADLYFGVIGWSLLFVCCLLSFLLSAFKYIFLKRTLNALWSIPKILWSFSKALSKSRPDQREFVRTPKEFIKD